MLRKLFNHKVRIFLSLVFVIILILVRAYEDNLFYDPFLNYFKTDYFNFPLPVINNFQLFLGLFFRYFLNTLCSLGIIYVLFKDFEAVKFAAILYLLFFIILIIAFFLGLYYFGQAHKMTLFYIRRFLIQPLFLLLFLPAFYYQKQTN